MRKEFIKVATKLAEENSATVLLGDISVGGFLDGEILKKNVHNVGILEQAMVSFAAGIASAGGYPIVQTIIPFLVERAFEQIKLDVCAQKNPVALIGVGGGLEYSKLGYTHQCLWDTALLSQLPNLPIFTPTYSILEVSNALELHVSKREPIYLRLTDALLTNYSQTVEVNPYELVKINDTSSETAIIFCGAYPGINSDFEAYKSEHDIYAYSYTNRIPDNLNLLLDYKNITIIEFGTLPTLSNLIKQTGLKIKTSRYMNNFFFMQYGSTNAAKAISENWIEVLQ